MQEVRGSIPRTSTSKSRDCCSGSPSSRGLGHYPFTVGTGVRIPVGTPGPLQFLQRAMHKINACFCRTGKPVRGSRRPVRDCPIHCSRPRATSTLIYEFSDERRIATSRQCAFASDECCRTISIFLLNASSSSNLGTHVGGAARITLWLRESLRTCTGHAVVGKRSARGFQGAQGVVFTPSRSSRWPLARCTLA